MLNSKQRNHENPESQLELQEVEPGEIHLCYFTDPICIWSWAFEPHWIRLREALAGQVVFSVRMGGLVYPNDHRVRSPYAEKATAISYCAMVAAQTGVEYATTLWRENEVQSTYPACIAFHSVVNEAFERQLQFLRLMRQNYLLFGQAFMIEQDFHRLLTALAIDQHSFRQYWQSGRAYNEFLINLAGQMARGIHTVPTIRLQEEAKQPLLFHGYHHFRRLASAIRKAFPELIWYPPPPLPELLENYQPLTAYEIREIYELDDNAFQELLDQHRQRLTSRIENGVKLYCLT
jgi:putative protein-disulfide isomerase